MPAGPRPRRRRFGAIWFGSAILPPYLRRTRNIEELLPWLYLSVSTGQFTEALAALLGPGTGAVGGYGPAPHRGLAGGARALAGA